MPPVDLLSILPELVFKEFLKISPDLISKYTTVQDQLLYLILIPHAVLLLFLWSFGSWIARGHPKFHILLSVVGYIYLIWAGWYGTFIVPIIISWFMITIILAFGFFILTYIIHPARGPALYKLTGEIGGMIGEATIGKEKKRKELERQIENIDAQITRLRASKTGDRMTDRYIDLQIAEISRHKADLEHQLSKL